MLTSGRILRYIQFEARQASVTPVRCSYHAIIIEILNTIQMHTNSQTPKDRKDASDVRRRSHNAMPIYLLRDSTCSDQGSPSYTSMCNSGNWKLGDDIFILFSAHECILLIRSLSTSMSTVRINFSSNASGLRDFM